MEIIHTLNPHRKPTRVWRKAGKIQKGDTMIIGRTKVKVTTAKLFGFNQMSLQGRDSEGQTFFMTVPEDTMFQVKITEI